MELKKITAIIRSDRLEDVENRLKGPDTPGITVDHVKGYGEYANFFARDWTSRYARIEIVADEQQARSIADAIAEGLDSVTHLLEAGEIGLSQIQRLHHDFSWDCARHDRVDPNARPQFAGEGLGQRVDARFCGGVVTAARHRHGGRA